jgi:hypothetical protein
MGATRSGPAGSAPARTAMTRREPRRPGPRRPPGHRTGDDQLQGRRRIGQGDHARDMTQGAVHPELAERQCPRGQFPAAADWTVCWVGNPLSPVIRRRDDAPARRSSDGTGEAVANRRARESCLPMFVRVGHRLPERYPAVPDGRNFNTTQETTPCGLGPARSSDVDRLERCGGAPFNGPVSVGNCCGVRVGK